jgi:Mn2+/Fe2+ NRAMP family transporter
MNTASRDLSRPPAPHADRVKLGEIFFGVLGGPLAWYLQLCAGYALASAPCSRDGARMAAPLPVPQWTGPAMSVAMLGGVVIALLALGVSWLALRRNHREAAGESARRTRFLALWGVLLGSAFAVAAAMTAVAFILVPRCAG